MTIDERLEALTQSVELLASFHKDNEKRMEELVASQKNLNESMARLSDTMNQLGIVVLDHQRRLEDLEGRS
jgi:hypothetical protein